jgi:hypothetical protein
MFRRAPSGVAHGKGAEKMRRLAVVVLLVLAGCCNLRGPFAHRQPLRIDDPRIPISEQERRARDRLAMPDPSPNVAPRTGIEFPDPHGAIGSSHY